MTLLQQSVSSTHPQLQQSVRDAANPDLSTALGAAPQSTQDPQEVCWGGVADHILTPPPSENLRLESLDGVAESAPWALANDVSRRKTELLGHLEPSMEETLLSVYSPPTSSIASSSSCEDIASIADEKGPADAAGEDGLSEDATKTSVSQKVRFSESDEEVAGDEEEKSEKIIKLPQSKFFDNAPLLCMMKMRRSIPRTHYPNFLLTRKGRNAAVAVSLCPAIRPRQEVQ